MIKPNPEDREIFAGKINSEFYILYIFYLFLVVVDIAKRKTVIIWQKLLDGLQITVKVIIKINMHYASLKVKSV